MSKIEKVKLSKRIIIGFKPEEYNKVNTAFKTTTKRNLSEYIRYVLLEKPVTFYTRNQSLDNLTTELVFLRNELSAIGSNFNQLVKRMHAASHIQEIKQLALRCQSDQEKFTEKVKEINLKIAELSDKWLQE